MTAAEPKLFKREMVAAHAAPFTGSPSPIRRQKFRQPCARALVNHKPKRGKHGDAHQGYVHRTLDDLRNSQQAMTDYLLAQIEPKPGRGNVVLLKGHIA